MAKIQGSNGRHAPVYRAPATRIDRLLHLASRGLGRLGSRRKLAILSVGCLTYFLAAATSLLWWPQPHIHDEFSYLLAADTFAGGRLSNPTHPLWVHFETFHVIQRPTYVSKYPPGQGLALAAGQAIFGHPVFGVWLSTAFAVGAVCWMLLAWMPPRWALIGSLIAMVHPTIRFWSHCYCGGSVALLGGALLLGAARRTVKEPNRLDSAVMGIGLILLVNSRPYEGSVLGLLVVSGLLWWMVGRTGPSWLRSLKDVLLPLSIVLAVGICAMGYYCFRTTGSVLRLPYLVYEETYGVTPLFIWQEPRELHTYHHDVIRRYYSEELNEFSKNFSSYKNLTSFITERTRWVLFTIFNWLVGVGFVQCLALPGLWRHRATRCVLAAFCILIILSYLTTWIQTHYLAPAFGLALILEMRALRILRAWKWDGGRTGMLAVRGILALYILLVLSSLLHPPGTVSQSDRATDFPERSHIQETLKQMGDRHLVLVRYGPSHNAHREWVYNEADIDRSKVVWAREMDPDRNFNLTEYFKDRKVWLLEADSVPPRLAAYFKPSDAKMIR